MDSLVPAGDPKVVDQMQKRKENKRWDTVIRWGVRVTVLVLVLLVAFLLKVAYDNRDLPDLVEAQRDQFIKCQDEASDTPGCDKPVVTEKEVKEAKEGQRGLPGIPGDTGPQGLVGPPGPAPSSSQLLALIMSTLNQIIPTGQLDGPAGAKGEDGASVKGDPGTSIKGDTGATGAKGDKGDTGERGPTGADGAAGKNGQDAAPAPTVTAIVCDGSTGVFTYSDGAVFRVADMCQGALLPVPEPTEGVG